MAEETKEIPQWAKEKVALVAQYPSWERFENFHLGQLAKSGDALRIAKNFARFIAKHEKPPVDPDLLKAREICAKVADTLFEDDAAKCYRDGGFDGDHEVQFALSALKAARWKG